jgi:hypothetical protein
MARFGEEGGTRERDVRPWGKEVEGFRKHRLTGATTPKWIEEFVWE